MIPHRSVPPNLGQAMHLLSGATYNTKLSKPGSRLDRLFKSNASNQQMIEELYLASFSRFPTPAEMATLVRMVESRPVRKQAFEDLAWGLIVSREFAYNH